MSGYTTLRRPATNAQWARDVSDQLGNLANPTTMRVGNWVLSDLNGELVATAPGQAMRVLGGASELDLESLDLSGFLTSADLGPYALLDQVPDLTSFQGILKLLEGWTSGIPILGQLVEALTGAAGNLGNLTSWAGTIPALVSGLLNVSWIPGLDASKIISGIFGTGLIPGLDVSKIVSGVFGSGFIPGLDASKITTGTFGAGLLQPVIDAVSQGFGGSTGLGFSGLQSFLGGLSFGGISFDDLIGLIPGIGSGLSGSTGLGSIFTDLTGLLGSPTSLGSGTPVLPGIGSIPILGGLLSGGSLLGSLIPGLDASKITSGTFGQSMITNLTSDLANLLPINIFNSSTTNGSNGVIDPSFENPAVGRNEWWTVSGDGYSTDHAHSGTHSYKITESSGGYDGFDLLPTSVPRGGAGGTVLEPVLKVAPGQQYYGELWVYPLTSAGTIDFSVAFYDTHGVNGVTNASFVSPAYALPTPAANTWTKIGGTYVTVPAGYDRMEPYFEVNDDAPGLVVYVDDAVIRDDTQSQNIIASLWGGTSIGTTILGSLIPNLPASILTSGTLLSSLIPGLDASKIITGTFGTGMIPGLDTSKITSGTFGQSMIEGLLSTFNALTSKGSNLVPDPGFTDSAVTRYGAGGRTYSTTVAHSGSQSYKLTGPNAEWDIIGQYGSASQALKVSPGDKFYLEAWIYRPNTNTVGGAVGFFMDYRDTSNAFLSTSTIYSGAQPTANTWTKISGYATVPAGAVYAMPYLWLNGSTPSGDVLYIDDAVVREVTEAQNLTQGLFGGTSVGSSILSSVVPGLDASKIITGTFGSGLIPGLDVSKITSGVFGSGFIPSLDASKITTGIFGSSLIPNITKAMSTDMQGIIDNVYQAVNGGSSTGNTLASVKTSLLNFPGANIVSALASSVIPALDASKITTGSFAQSMITNLVSDLSGKAAASTVTSGFQNIYNNWFGGSGATGTPAEVATAVASIKSAVTGGWTVVIKSASDAAWLVPSGISQLAGGVINGGGKGAVGSATTATTAAGGAGGSSGGYLYSQLDLTGITPGTDTLNITVGAAASTSGTDGGQSSIKFGATTLLAGAANASGIAGPEGLVGTTSTPGKGGNGGTGQSTGTSGSGTAGGNSGVATGGAGGTGGAAGAGTGASGSNGGAGTSGSVPLCGGGGGGGGAGKGTGNIVQAVTGGTGGNGGAPGGGSGGGGGATNSGGGTRTGGASGTPGAGLVVLLYK